MRTIERADRGGLSSVLVGGRKPEEIEQEHIEGKRREREAIGREGRTKPGVTAEIDQVIYGSGPLQKLKNGNFVFFDVPYRNRIIECIERPMALVDGGKEKTQQSHLDWLVDPKNNPDGFTLTPLEIEYQLARIAFDHYHNPTHGQVAKAYIDSLSPFLRRMLVSADIVMYHENNLAVVDSAGCLAGQCTLTLPDSMKDIYIIGKERSVKDSTYRPDIPSEAMIFLQAILGPYAERASTVFPYCVGLDIGVDDASLIQTRFETRYSESFPITARPHQCVGCYGLGSNSRTFSIHANGSPEGSWPALLVAERKTRHQPSRAAPIERLVEMNASRPPSPPGGSP